MRSDGGLMDEYLRWIFMEKLRFSRRKTEPFLELGEDLMKIDYFWINEFDKNRAEDGIYLRREFLDENWSDTIFGDPKVLEVLVEFAIRIDSEYVGDPSEPNPGDIFLMFLENLGLTRMLNVKKYSKTFLKSIIGHWMYDDPGVIFGFKNSPKTAQLWSFMLKWVSNQ